MIKPNLGFDSSVCFYELNQQNFLPAKSSSQLERHLWPKRLGLKPETFDTGLGNSGFRPDMNDLGICWPKLETDEQTMGVVSLVWRLTSLIWGLADQMWG